MRMQRRIKKHKKGNTYMEYKGKRTSRKKYGVNIRIYEAQDGKLESQKKIIASRIVEINELLAGKVDILSLEEINDLKEEQAVIKEAYADIRDEQIRRKRRSLERTSINLSYLS